MRLILTLVYSVLADTYIYLKITKLCPERYGKTGNVPESVRNL